VSGGQVSSSQVSSSQVSSSMRGRVLIVAGSDSGGGAGIQADIKSVTALGGYAATAITALTAQDTLGVHDVLGIDPAFIALQMELVLADIGADCIKIGMLHTSAVIEAVAQVIERKARGIPLLLDPVMVAKGGQLLLEPSAIEALKQHLIPRASLITPNLPEAAALLGHAIGSRQAMLESAPKLLALGCKAALLKGGHLAGALVFDMLATAHEVEIFESPRIESRNTHGTGCSLASAIATGIAQGLELRAAVERARAYVWEAIRSAPGFGRGHGPLNHAHTMRPFPEE
jgi:hydroxymethylpyrimidine/phosphomethylpyrimidine kinase